MKKKNKTAENVVSGIVILVLILLMILCGCEKSGYDCEQQVINSNGDTIPASFHIEAKDLKCILINNDSISTECSWYGD